MCLPAVAEIVVTNTAPTDPIDVYSVSTDSAAFQPSYVERQTVVPGESVTLTVLFLARAPGPVFGSLVMETSVGGFLVQVQGEGIDNSVDTSTALKNALIVRRFCHQVC